MTNSAKTAIDQLMSSKELGSITKQLRLARSLQRDLEQILSDRFRGKCRVLHLEKSTVTLSVRSSIIATQMRLITGQLLEQLHSQGGEVAKRIKVIKIRMIPATVDLARTSPRRMLDGQSAAKFKQLSSRVKNAKLALSLNRLAQQKT